MPRRGSSSKTRPPVLRAAHAYLDVACDLVRLPDGRSRVILSFRNWAGGGRLSMHDDFADEDRAADVVESARSLFGLRKLPGRDQWQNMPSSGFRRAIWRVSGRFRRVSRDRRLARSRLVIPDEA